MLTIKEITRYLLRVVTDCANGIDLEVSNIQFRDDTLIIETKDEKSPNKIQSIKIDSNGCDVLRSAVIHLQPKRKENNGKTN